MYIKRILFFSILIFFNLNAELLILKQTASGFEPLSQDDIDRNGNAISQIILKYQWPMCIISELTKEEKAEISSSNPCAEEIFIEKKLREISDEYRVVFIPTVLYELFFLLHSVDDFSHSNSIKNICKLAASRKIELDPNRELALKINAYKAENNPKPLSEQLNDIKQFYRIYNNLIYDIDSLNKQKLSSMELFTISPYILANQKIIQFLFSTGHVKRFQESSTSLDFSTNIKEDANFMLDYLVQQLKDVMSKPGRSSYSCLIAPLLIDYLGSIHIVDSFKRMIVLEYEARELNRGILVRGTKQIVSEIEEYSDDMSMLSSRINSIATTMYKNTMGNSKLYSISFGNSLFAGIVQDIKACAYHYLFICDAFGYTIFINKNQYLTHQLFNLFYISPLSTIAGIIAGGELFHSRTKIPCVDTAVLPHLDLYHHIHTTYYSIEGLFARLNNVNGILLVKQNPLEFERLFTSYVSENGRIIHTPKDYISSGVSDRVEKNIELEDAKFKEDQKRLAKSAKTKGNVYRHSKKWLKNTKKKVT